jgi:hypothetical protein
VTLVRSERWRRPADPAKSRRGAILLLYVVLALAVGFMAGERAADRGGDPRRFVPIPADVA